MKQKLKPISEVPPGREVLAWHTAGGNFHQVKWDDSRKQFGMRWNNEYSQALACYSGWLPMPIIEI